MKLKSIQLLVILSMLLIGASSVIAQQSVPTCSFYQYEGAGNRVTPSPSDQSLVQLAAPSTTGALSVDCLFIKKTLASTELYFVVYDFNNSAPRQTYLGVLKAGSGGSPTVLAMLSPTEAGLSGMLTSFELSMAEFPIAQRSDFVFQVIFNMGKTDSTNMYAWDGKKLRAIGPDPRTQLTPMPNGSTRAAFENISLLNSQSQSQTYSGSIFVKENGVSPAESRVYRIPLDIYEPWPLVSSSFGEGHVTLSPEDIGQTDTTVVEQLGSGQIRETTQLQELSAPEEQESYILRIWYPQATHVPTSVQLKSGDLFLYQKQSGDPATAFVRRIRRSDMTSDSQTTLIVEGPSESSVSYAMFQPACDLNQDGYIDSRDITLIEQAIGQQIGITDDRDQNGNGVVDVADKERCKEQCAMTNCAVALLDVPSVNISPLTVTATANEHSVLDRTTRKITSTATVTISNSSTSNVPAPLYAIVYIDNSTGLVQMPEALGGIGLPPFDTYYYDLTSSLSSGQLAVGQGVAFTIKFVRSSTVTFSYRVVPYAMGH